MRMPIENLRVKFTKHNLNVYLVYPLTSLVSVIVLVFIFMPFISQPLDSFNVLPDEIENPLYVERAEPELNPTDNLSFSVQSPNNDTSILDGKIRVECNIAHDSGYLTAGRQYIFKCNSFYYNTSQIPGDFRDDSGPNGIFEIELVQREEEEIRDQDIVTAGMPGVENQTNITSVSPGWYKLRIQREEKFHEKYYVNRDYSEEETYLTDAPFRVYSPSTISQQNLQRNLIVLNLFVISSYIISAISLQRDKKDSN